MPAADSFISKLKFSRGGSVERVYLIFIVSAGNRWRRYFFIKPFPIAEKKLLVRIKDTAPFDLKDYGEILASGYGHPSPELKEEMALRYHIIYTDSE